MKQNGIINVRQTDNTRKTASVTGNKQETIIFCNTTICLNIFISG